VLEEEVLKDNIYVPKLFKLTSGKLISFFFNFSTLFISMGGEGGATPTSSSRVTCIGLDFKDDLKLSEITTLEI